MLKYLLIVFLAVNSAVAQTAAIQPLLKPAAGRVLVVAHRGDWRNAPENSLRAFEYAAAMGVDIVELDLNKTKDSQIIIMHDDRIDRTTDGKGRPEDYTLEELKKFRLKDGSGRVTNNSIPTLREVMTALKGKKIMVNLDKSYEYYNEAFSILKETGTLRQGIFKSEATYAELKQRYPHLLDSIVYMPVIKLDKPQAMQVIAAYLQHMKPYAFELIFRFDTSAVLNNPEFITKQGPAIWINSLWSWLNAGHDDDRAVEEGNTKDSWGWLLAHGATIIQTDRPKELIQYLRKKRSGNSNN